MLPRPRKILVSKTYLAFPNKQFATYIINQKDFFLNSKFVNQPSLESTA